MAEHTAPTKFQTATLRIGFAPVGGSFDIIAKDDNGAQHTVGNSVDTEAAKVAGANFERVARAADAAGCKSVPLDWADMAWAAAEGHERFIRLAAAFGMEA